MQCVSSCSGGLACMQCAPFPHRKKTVVASQFAMGSSLLSQSPCMMEQSGMGTYVASPSFYPSFHRYHSPLIMHDDDSFSVLTLSLSRSLVLFMFICFSSALSMPPFCSGQVGHPRLPNQRALLRSRQGRSQVCDESRCGLGLDGARTGSRAATCNGQANCHTARCQHGGCFCILRAVVAHNERFQ